MMFIVYEVKIDYETDVVTQRAVKTWLSDREDAEEWINSEGDGDALYTIVECIYPERN